MTTKLVSMFCSSFAAFMLGLLLSPHLMLPNGDPQRADAAFSDGIFQATLDFQSGRAPHLAVGRWSSAEDRFAFAKGYEQRWRELFKDAAANVPLADDAQLTGYRDGIVEGAEAGKTQQRLQVAGGAKSQAAAGAHVSRYNNGDKQHYLDGYAAGYKAGYSAQRDVKTVAVRR